jgi:hypothetical protein
MKQYFFYNFLLIFNIIYCSKDSFESDNIQNRISQISENTKNFLIQTFGINEEDFLPRIPGERRNALLFNINKRNSINSDSSKIGSDGKYMDPYEYIYKKIQEEDAQKETNEQYKINQEKNKDININNYVGEPNQNSSLLKSIVNNNRQDSIVSNYNTQVPKNSINSLNINQICVSSKYLSSQYEILDDEILENNDQNNILNFDHYQRGSTQFQQNKKRDSFELFSNSFPYSLQEKQNKYCPIIIIPKKENIINQKNQNIPPNQEENIPSNQKELDNFLNQFPQKYSLIINNNKYNQEEQEKNNNQNSNQPPNRLTIFHKNKKNDF